MGGRASGLLKQESGTSQTLEFTMPKAIPVSSMLGERFGLWAVISLHETVIKKFSTGRTQRKSYFNCVCICGVNRVVDMFKLRAKEPTGCGCINRKLSAIRRRSGEIPVADLKVEYQAWINMRRRCYDPSAKDYPNYSQRGITVCDEWRNSFRAFHRDMGNRPEGMKSIDRIDNDKGYSKDNCRWATLFQQANNMSTNKVYEYNGEFGTSPFWARKYGIKLATMHARLNWLGWSIEKAIIPPKPRVKRIK
jgi:hypothetical protein